jgi:hypothetical protein
MLMAYLVDKVEVEQEIIEATLTMVLLILAVAVEALHSSLVQVVMAVQE